METIKILGAEIPRYVDCPRCGKKDACKWANFDYSKPCQDCKNSPEYEAEQKNKKRLEDGIGTAFKNQRATAVYKVKNHNVWINHNGDIIKDEPYKPLKAGK